VDDSYNSNPRALIRALEVIAAEPAERRVAVLGEMLELGERSVQLHEECGRAAAAAGLSALITVGGMPAGAMAAAAVASGMPAGAVRHLSNSPEAAKEAAAIVRAGDLVLVKGSRGVRTDLVVDGLKAGQA
jgi:UDP-N-acetylmuramoyl-tripeptide--D-alanyl-D-alanine ligase